jgi:hypothetical protein
MTVLKGFALSGWFTICAAILVSPIAAAQQHGHYSRSELHRMMRDASTADQYKALAVWFRQEETTFRMKAEAEDIEYLRYKSRTVGSKYPTPADSARALSD